MSKEKLKNKNHGITLIALIITVIVLLILVGVTLSVTLGDNGLVNKAKEASEATEIAMDRELLLSAVVGTIDDNGEVNLGAIVLPEGFTESNGTYTSKNGHTFNVGLDGAVTYVGGESPEGPESSSEDLELLRRYFLGEVDEATGERPGGDLLSLIENPEELFGPEGLNNAKNTKFISNNIILDAADTLSVTAISMYGGGEYPPIYLYLQYKNNPYILLIEMEPDDQSGFVVTSKSVEKLPVSNLNFYGTYYGHTRICYDYQK